MELSRPRLVRKRALYRGRVLERIKLCLYACRSRVGLLVSIIAVATAGFGLPIALVAEFGAAEALDYARLYPHMVLWPPLFFWIVVVGAASATCCALGVDRGRRKRVFQALALAVVGGVILLPIELAGAPMLLFEINPATQSHFEFPDQILQYTFSTNAEIAEEIASAPGAASPSPQKALRPEFWEGRAGWWSWSRIFYAASYSLVVASVIFLLLLFRARPPENHATFTRFTESLLLAALPFLAWLALRFYYNATIKSELEPGAATVNPFDAVCLFALFAYAVLCCVRLFKVNSELIKLFAAAAAGIATGVSAFRPDFVHVAFGLNVGVRYWIALSVALVVVVLAFFEPTGLDSPWPLKKKHPLNIDDLGIGGGEPATSGDTHVAASRDEV